MAALRFSLLGIALCLAAFPAMAQDAAEWKRGEAKNVVYANMVTKKGDLFGFFCRKVQNKYVGGIVMKMPSFNTLIRDEQTYSLNIVIDGGRDSVIFKAKDIELWFEGNDLNQQLTLSRLYDAIRASHRLEMGIAAIGWRGSYDFSDAAAKLDGLMTNCL